MRARLTELDELALLTLLRSDQGSTAFRVADIITSRTFGFQVIYNHRKARAGRIHFKRLRQRLVSLNWAFVHRYAGACSIHQ
jgi:hypothetical protein